MHHIGFYYIKKTNFLTFCIIFSFLCNKKDKNCVNVSKEDRKRNMDYSIERWTHFSQGKIKQTITKETYSVCVKNEAGKATCDATLTAFEKFQCRMCK